MLYEIEGLLGSEQRKKGLRQKAADGSSERKRVLRLAEVNDLASHDRRANWIDAFNHEKERTNLALPAYAVPEPGQYSFIHRPAAYHHSCSSLSCLLLYRLGSKQGRAEYRSLSGPLHIPQPYSKLRSTSRIKSKQG